MLYSYCAALLVATIGLPGLQSRVIGETLGHGRVRIVDVDPVRITPCRIVERHLGR